MENNEDNVAYLLVKYRCLSLPELKAVLELEHGLNKSVFQLSRLSRKHGISRRGPDEPSNEMLTTVIKDILVGLPSTTGYRTVWTMLRQQHNLNVRRPKVMSIMKAIDPDGCELRRKGKLLRRVYSVAGPNALWHVDGYDKLKPFGFCIHGCIDGYSRKVIWLEVGPTNNNPKVIGGYYMNAIEHLGGVPRVVRADCGTENVLMEKLQRALRHGHGDTMASKPFLYGKSTRNQRIERLWGSLRTMALGNFRDLFESLESRGILSNANCLHIYSLRYCFMGLVRQSLTKFTAMWNHHLVRRSALAVTGRPSVLYANKEADCMFPVADNDANSLCELCERVDDIPEDFLQFADHVFVDWPDPDPTPSSEQQLQRAIDQLIYLIRAADAAS